MALLALDLFCKAGGTTKGLQRAGFRVVGVDIENQPNYCGDEFVCSDALTFPIKGFDFIWASPPCQAHSNAQRIRGNKHADLISAIRDRIEGGPYCIENVAGAPLREPMVLCGAMFGLKTYRHRLFECSFLIIAPAHPEHVAPNRKMGRPVRDGEYMHIVGNFSGAARAREIMETPWMTRDEMREAIPPTYAEYIGRAAIAHIKRQRVA